jgi:hypothetical protein
MVTLPSPELGLIYRRDGELAVDGFNLSRSSKMMSRIMNKQLSLALQIEEWTREAVVQCGDDWERIAAHIRSRFAKVGDAERERLASEASLTLRTPSGTEPDNSVN